MASKGAARAFLFKIAEETNASKLRALEALQAEWRRTLPQAFAWYWTPFLRGGLLPRNPPRSGPKSTFPTTQLVTSQKDLMAVAIEGQAKSWSSNLQNRIARSLMRDAMLARDTGLRRQLLWINSMKAWLLPYKAQCTLLAAQPAKSDALTILSPEASRIMRKLVRSYIDRFKLPDPLQLPMQVNQLSSVMAKASKTAAPWAESWLRISTLTRGQKVSLPVIANAYAQKRGGLRATTYALVKRDRGWYAIGTQYLTPTPWADTRTDVLGVDCDSDSDNTSHRTRSEAEGRSENHPRTEVLGIDLGLRNLLSTSEGDVFGVGFLNILRQYDDQLQRIQRGLQGAGQYKLKECKRYRLFVQRFRGWLKTFIQTQVKRLLAMRRPKKVIIEELFFAGPDSGLSRRMNRLVRTFGLRTFTQCLEQHQELYGFELEKVEPAYGSQTCASCGFVHRSNRNGDEFKCHACGHRAHADVNAAKNLVRRSGRKASSAPGGHRTQWARSLHGWIARQRAALDADTCGLLRSRRAIGSTRAGLLKLTTDKKISASLRSHLLVACQESTSASLLTGLHVLEHATRYSG